MTELNKKEETILKKWLESKGISIHLGKRLKSGNYYLIEHISDLNVLVYNSDARGEYYDSESDAFGIASIKSLDYLLNSNQN